MEVIFKEEELRKYINDYYALYIGNGENNMTPKEIFEIGFRTGIVKALYDTGDER